MMKKVLLSVSIAGLFAGCTTPPKPVEVYKDKEPILVGESVDDILVASEANIRGQKDLLIKLKNKQPIYGVSPVVHNNNLDARQGSPKTISPYGEKYIKGDYGNQKIENNNVVVAQKERPIEKINPKLTQMIKKIDWKHNSLNDLAQGLANAGGYQFVVSNGKNSDVLIDFYAEGMNLQSVITKLKSEVSEYAEVLVIDKNNTLNVIYRK